MSALMFTGARSAMCPRNTIITTAYIVSFITNNKQSYNIYLIFQPAVFLHCYTAILRYDTHCSTMNKAPYYFLFSLFHCFVAINSIFKNCSDLNRMIFVSDNYIVFTLFVAETWSTPLLFILYFSQKSGALSSHNTRQDTMVGLTKARVRPQLLCFV